MNALGMISTPLVPAPMPMMCPEWVVLDIETEAGSPLEVEEYIRQTWWPDVRVKDDGKIEGWKDDTIGDRFRKATVDWHKRAALLDSATVATVQVKTAAGHLDFHRFADKVPARADLVACSDEKQLLATVAAWLNANCGEGTTIVGWNINGYDLPKLRQHMVKQGVRLPPALMGMCGVLDLMKRYAYEFSVERSEMVALAKALEALGMVNHKKDMNGAMVGECLARGDYMKVIDYGIVDVQQEEAVFLKMTGRA